MYYYTTMSSVFESEKNRKAAMYTAIICAVILLLIYFITWPLPKPPVPLVEDLIEINLGNDAEGMGQVQPLIKGDMSPSREQSTPEQQLANPAKEEAAKDMTDDNKDAEAAAINKPPKPVITENIPKQPSTQPVKATNPTPAVTPVIKPQKPKVTYNGPGNGNGNGATEDKGYRMQGNNPNGKGDAGSPNGKPDSYGNNPGGRTGGSGLKVSKGDRRIVNNYIFMGELPKATINAIIKVSPDGRGTFIGRDKGSTSSDARYTTAIMGYLPNIKFDKADHESIVTVPFNFNVM
jgi:hypothetical protein